MVKVPHIFPLAFPNSFIFDNFFFLPEGSFKITLLLLCLQLLLGQVCVMVTV